VQTQFWQALLQLAVVLLAVIIHPIVCQTQVALVVAQEIATQVVQGQQIRGMPEAMEAATTLVVVVAVLVGQEQMLVALPQETEVLEFLLALQGHLLVVLVEVLVTVM